MKRIAYLIVVLAAFIGVVFFGCRPERVCDDATLLNEHEVVSVSLDPVSLISEIALKIGGYRPDLLRAIADPAPPTIRWPGWCQVLRKNCGTGWAQKYPQYVVSYWMGHDIKVSAQYYLQIPEQLYQEATASDLSKDARKCPKGCRQ